MGKGRSKLTAWDRKVKPAGMDPKKDDTPIPVDASVVRKRFKTDALKRDRMEGCRCRAVKARIVPPPPDAEEGTISVLTEPHREDCPIAASRRSARAPVGSSVQIVDNPPYRKRDTLAPTPSEAPEPDPADLSVVERGGLWVPGGD